MKTLVFFAAALAAGAQAREPENLAALVDEMAVLERVLGAALESEMSGLAASRDDVRALSYQTRMELEHWLQERVRAIEAEYLVRQGILVSLHFSRRPSVRDLPSALFTTVAKTGETRLPGLNASLQPADFAGLKELVDELDEVRRRHGQLLEEWHVELRDASKGGNLDRPIDSGPIGREIGASQAKQRELQTAIDKEVRRLRDLLVEMTEEPSTDDSHGVLMQAVCDYAMLKSLPDEEHLTLKVGQDKAGQDGRRTGRQWTYYVLAKQDVVDCRHGSIDAEELRERAYVYSRERP